MRWWGRLHSECTAGSYQQNIEHKALLTVYTLASHTRTYGGMLAVFLFLCRHPTTSKKCYCTLVGSAFLTLLSEETWDSVFQNNLDAFWHLLPDARLANFTADNLLLTFEFNWITISRHSSDIWPVLNSAINHLAYSLLCLLLVRARIRSFDYLR